MSLKNPLVSIQEGSKKFCKTLRTDEKMKVIHCVKAGDCWVKVCRV